MSHLAPSPAPTPVSTPWSRTAGRWMVSFLGFPAGGYAAYLLVGPVDGLVGALVGGMITGAVLGAIQAWALGALRPDPARWVAATALGLSAGLAIGSALVGYETSLAALLVQGALSGLGVGVAQTLLLRPRLGRTALVWPAALSAIWAIGWAVTSAVGVRVEDQFTVFGSSGALVVTALTAVLPLALASRAAASGVTTSGVTTSGNTTSGNTTGTSSDRSQS